MSISSIAADTYHLAISSQTEIAKAKESNKETTKTKDKRDTLEISSEAYHMQFSDETLSATSGKDYLDITKSKQKPNTYIIHFTDSAQISRTLQRGYLTINGIRINLTDDIKKQLEETDQKAQADREQAFAQHTLWHNLTVAQQQAETLQKAADDALKMMEIARRIAQGGKVPAKDEQKLMQHDPDLYMMAKTSAMTAKEHKKYDSLFQDENHKNNDTENSNSPSGWTSYETQMSVSLNEGTLEIQGVCESEVSVGI
ncbi:MAG: hypothetical protein HFI37_08980 [Lachnospiraceae bacterium]|nr:hypothetical protein [Lachnospiraceae bacterium]